MSHTFGTLGICLPVNDSFFVGDVKFTVTEIRHNWVKKHYTCALTYAAQEKEGVIILKQNHELPFYSELLSPVFMWIGKRTTSSIAHVFISAYKNVPIRRENYV
jgi:hypothetical protein